MDRRQNACAREKIYIVFSVGEAIPVVRFEALPAEVAPSAMVRNAARTKVVSA
jgi:hypothetical protein